MQIIDNAVKRIDTLSNEVLTLTSGLDSEMLNRKPSPDSWSIAQCLDHLIVLNSLYFPQLEATISGKPQPNFWKSFPVLPGFFGKLLKRSVRPDEKKKFKTMNVFEPSSSDLPADIVDKFIKMQDEMKDIFNRLRNRNLQEEKVTSPAGRFITYSVEDLIEIILLHEERHIIQAKNLAAVLQN